MTNESISEGGFLYNFGQNANAVKYDQWSHYRNRFQGTCGGAKAVDLVFLDGDTLWLVEIKDYRRSSRSKTSSLSQEVAEKVRDTIAGLVSARLYADLPIERERSERFLACRRIKVAIHLEQPNFSSGARPTPINPANVLTELKRLIKWIDCHPKVFDRSNTDGIPLSIERIGLP